MPDIALNTVVYNEAHRIVGMLDSAAQLCDEFVVVDQDSTDDTKAIAEAWGALVVPDHHWGYCEVSRPLAAVHTNADWILVLDGDEKIVPEKVDALRAARAKYRAVRLGRLHYVDGVRQIPHQADLQLRFFQKGTVEYGLSLHTRIDSAYAVLELPGAILHEKSQAEHLIDEAQWRSVLEAAAAARDRR